MMFERYYKRPRRFIDRIIEEPGRTLMNFVISFWLYLMIYGGAAILLLIAYGFVCLICNAR